MDYRVWNVPNYETERCYYQIKLSFAQHLQWYVMILPRTALSKTSLLELTPPFNINVARIFRLK